MKQRSWSEETSADTAKELINEKNSLRRFLAGLTATTFGVLVALHPNEFTSQLCGWFYVSSVIANALSVICFISSLFGRYWGLIEKGANQAGEERANWRGDDYIPKKMKCAGRFRVYSIIGIASYIIAILSSCTYIILGVCAC